MSRGPLDASLLAFEHDRRFSGMLWSPITFRIRVSHQAQEPPFEFLPTELGIQQGASWRTYNPPRPHRGRDRQPPQPTSTATPADRYKARLRRDEVLGGLIN